jgi:hypothetical protein
MAYAPCGFILGVVIEWGSLIKAIRITRRDVMLIQLFGTINDGLERFVCGGEPSK